jgi:hypothetical protein
MLCGQVAVPIAVVSGGIAGSGQGRTLGPAKDEQGRCHASKFTLSAGEDGMKLYSSGRGIPIPRQSLQEKEPDEALRITPSRRGRHSDRNRRAAAIKHIRAYLRLKYSHQHQLGLDDGGTGSKTLHEKVKNHILNNIDMGYEKDLEAVIAAYSEAAHQYNMTLSDTPARLPTVSLNQDFSAKGTRQRDLEAGNDLQITAASFQMESPLRRRRTLSKPPTRLRSDGGHTAIVLGRK